jgi:mono/diheme cytochrome c family protein
MKQGIKIVFVFLFTTIFALFSCAKTKPKRLSIQESVRVEASFYRSNCVICHGAEAEGKDIGGRITPSMRNGEALTRSDEYLFDKIQNGGNGMPPFKYQMTEQQIRNMVQFIRDLQKETP